MVRALFGGSFDPAHLGHLALVKHLLDHDLAQTVVVVPTWRSPHKYENSASPANRLAMVHLAFDPLPAVTVDDREILRGRTSYTVETLEELTAEHPDDQWRLVIGADNLGGFTGWRSPGRLQELADIVIYPRDGLVANSETILRAGLDPNRVIPVADFDHPVSSTTVRAMLAAGKVPDRQLPDAVAAYIDERGLYLA